jgi:S1-C subfamily serine protease
MKRQHFAWIGIGLVFLGASASASSTELTEAYRRVKSSVVVIETKQKEVDRATQVGLVSVGGLGSGVLISEDGKVATAAHVVQTADEIMVQFISGEKIRARVAGSEPAADVALLQLERRPAVAQVAQLGDSDAVEVGDEVFVVGAPLGITHSLTVGHISARRLDDNFTSGFYSTEVFQTDAAINQGNSGGPMFNMKGEVIGIVSYIISKGGGFEGLGFVITSKMFKQLLLNERAIWTGIQGQIIAGDLARVFHVPTGVGLLVEVVADRSLATHLGIEGGIARATIADQEFIVGGDVIIEAMGVSLADKGAREQIRQQFEALKAGDEISVKVLRAGKIVELKNYFFPDVLLPAGPKD